MNRKLSLAHVLLLGPLLGCVVVVGERKREGHISFDQGPLLRYETKDSGEDGELEVSAKVETLEEHVLILKVEGVLCSTELERPVFQKLERFKVLNSAGQAALAQADREYETWAAQKRVVYEAKELQRQYVTAAYNPGPIDRFNMNLDGFADSMGRFGVMGAAPTPESFFGDPRFYDVEVASAGVITGPWERVPRRERIGDLHGATVTIDMGDRLAAATTDEQGLARFDILAGEVSGATLEVQVQFRGMPDDVLVRLEQGSGGEQ